MPLVKVASREALPPGSMIEVDAEGTPIALCNVDGTFYAVHGICPHRDAPLGHGALHGRTIVCPWHAWEFDCVTGCSDIDPDLKLKTYAVTVEDNDIYVDLP